MRLHTATLFFENPSAENTQRREVPRELTRANTSFGQSKYNNIAPVVGAEEKKSEDHVELPMPDATRDALTISTRTTVWMRIQVVDNGIGISTEALQRLWHPFYQIEAGASQQGKGSGLGLSICKEIVQRHGGRVGAVSTQGSGCTFYSEVPFEICNEPAQESMGSTALSTVSSTKNVCEPPADNPQAAIVDHLVILLVDDGNVLLCRLN
jgi:hypothetical protein